MTLHLKLVEFLRTLIMEKNYEKLIDACDSLDISLRDPKLFPETRFRNSCF